MHRARRALAAVATLALLAVIAVPTTLAAGPERFVIDLDDPQIDIDESAWASDLCGFPVDARMGGHIILMAFPDDRRRPLGLDVYGIRATYTNVATGATAQLRDVGPDRFYMRDGHLHLAITGRSLTGSGVIGVVILDLDTGETVFVAGNEVGNFNDQFCSAID